MTEHTTNFNLEKQQPEGFVDITGINSNFDKIDSALGNVAKFETAGGTGDKITLAGFEFENGNSKTFVVKVNNNGSATSINDKPLYKTGTTVAPKLIKDKAVTVWYNSTGDCFFIKASAEGDAIAENVLAGKIFSTEDDIGITGTGVDNGAVSVTLASNNQEYTVSKGFHNGLGKIKALITGLVASVIKAGEVVGGITGTFTADATALVGEVLSGRIFYKNGVRYTGIMASYDSSSEAVAVSASNGQIYLQPNTGYHHGYAIYANDTDFVASNILSTKNIFGLQGTLTNKNPYTTAQSVYVSVVDGIVYVRVPRGAYLDETSSGYPELTISGQGDLKPANILQGKTILGVAGTAQLGRKYLYTTSTPITKGSIQCYYEITQSWTGYNGDGSVFSLNGLSFKPYMVQILLYLADGRHIMANVGAGDTYVYWFVVNQGNALAWRSIFQGGGSFLTNNGFNIPAVGNADGAYTASYVSVWE